MDTIVGYGACILDLTYTLMEHQDGLNSKQIEQVEMIHRRTELFIEEYMQKNRVTINELRSYLNHDAITPVTIIIGSTELMIMQAMGELKDAYLEAVEYIRDYGYALHHEIRQMHDELWGFMQQMGIER